MSTRERTRVRRDRTAAPLAAARARFARRRWRGRLDRLRIVVLVVLGAAALAGVGWVLWFSQLLAVDQVQVDGVGVLSEGQVQSAAGVAAGTPLARVDLAATADRVRELPAVADVSVSRGWPGTLAIEVTEREAVAVLQQGGDHLGLDGSGVIFRTFASPPDDLPLVLADELEGVTGADAAPVARADALAEVAAVVESLDGPMSDRVHHVEVASLDAIELVLRDGALVRWGSAADSALKADVLAALMQVPAATYDVSVPQLPTTSGTAPTS